jgi:hypothetical protein
MLAVICHFVQFSGGKSARAFRLGAGRFLETGQKTGFCPVFILAL